MKTKSFVAVADDNDPRIGMQEIRVEANPENWGDDEYLAMLEERFEDPAMLASATPLERELYVRFASLMASYKRLEAELDDECMA